MYGKFKDHLIKEINDISEAGLYKNERIIVSPQQAEIKLNSGQEVLNFCANNYLGLIQSSGIDQSCQRCS